MILFKILKRITFIILLFTYVPILLFASIALMIFLGIDKSNSFLDKYCLPIIDLSE